MSEDDAENARAAGVEVCWVDARSQRQAAGLDWVGEIAFEDGVPVRDFPSYRRQRHFPGWYFATTGTRIGFESWLERPVDRTNPGQVTFPVMPATGTSTPAEHGQDQYPPRPRPQAWGETVQTRDEIEKRLSSPPFLPASAEVRRSMRRGLAALLDWLETKPGLTWQDRWLASGAEAAGPAWTDLVTGTSAALAAKPAGRVRNDLLSAMRLMLTGQVLRPGYPWLLRYRPSVLLEEARSRIDPAGFARLRAHFDATGRRNPRTARKHSTGSPGSCSARAA